MATKKTTRRPSKQRGPGQPPKPANQKRTIIKEVAFSPDEWQQLEKLVGEEKTATYIRRRALENSSIDNRNRK